MAHKAGNRHHLCAKAPCCQPIESNSAERLAEMADSHYIAG